MDHLFCLPRLCYRLDAEVKKLLLQKYPSSKCEKWACYGRTIKSTAAPGTVIKAGDSLDFRCQTVNNVASFFVFSLF